jgi:hypothetical protein
MKRRRRPSAGALWRGRAQGASLMGTHVNSAGRTVQHQSLAEHLRHLRLDRRADVRDYLSQPTRVSYCDGVHDAASERERPMGRHDLMGRALARGRDVAYVIVADQDTPQPSEAANLLALTRFRPLAYARPAVTRAVSELMHDGAPRLLGDLHQTLLETVDLPANEIFCGLCHLLWHDRLSVDLCVSVLDYDTPGAFNPRALARWREDATS